MNRCRSRLLATAVTAATLAATLPVILPQAAMAQDRGVQALFDQARYWRLQSRPEQALRAYERVLSVDNDNVEALQGAAEVQAELGNRTAADALLARLRQAAPAADPRVNQASREVRAAAIDPAAIAEARRLAQAGQQQAAIQQYQRLFGGTTPPDSYAVEYYQTLAGTPTGKVEAQQGLARLSARNPQDPRSALAYAQTLTYDESTRAQGIERLRQLAQRPNTAQAATAAWREALSWSGPNPQAIPQFEAYLQQFPNDTVIQQRLAEARNPPQGPRDVVGDTRSQAFTALNSNRVADAGAQFQSVLDDNPNDPDALGGLGVVRLRQGRTAEARRLLTRAIELDPQQGRQKWGRALAGANYVGEVTQARSQVLQGNLDQAEQRLQRVVRQDGGERADAEALLGDIALRRNDPVGAEQRYRAALARRPSLPSALAGLYDALQQQGRFAEAEQLAQRAGSANLASAVGVQRAEALRSEASRTENAEAAIALLRGAQAADPGSPWIRLDLARLLARQGQAAEARVLIEDPVNNQRATQDALYAAALFANEDNRPQDAARYIERIPDRVRTADATRLLRTVRLSEQVAAAAEPARYGRLDMARARLLQLASRPDPTGSIPAQVVSTLNTLGDKAGAAEAARVAASVNRNAPPEGRLAIAGALLDAGLEADSMALAQGLSTDGRLTADQRRQVTQLQSGAAIRASDRLNTAGDQASAYDRLAPALVADPASPAANLALARLYQSAREPQDAQRIAEAVLQRDPRNIDARGAAIDAAVGLRDWSRAEALLAEAQAMAPNDPRVSMLEARYARASGDGRRARRALEVAAQQRRNQLGGDVANGGYAVAPGMPTNTAANAPTAYENPFRRTPLAGTGQVATTTAVPAPMPYGYGRQPVQMAQAGSFPVSPSQGGSFGGTTMVRTDPLLADINRQLTEVRDETASRVAPVVGFRTRSGDNGLDKLSEFSGSVEGSTSALSGRITARVSPITIDSGSMSQDNGTLRRFGTNALVLPNPATTITSAQASSLTPNDTSASGVALGIAYTRPNFSIDVGTTPLGFQQSNVVGGIEMAPEIGQGLRLRVTGERRAVTDSLLSWSGMRDARTGEKWGGVTRTGGRAQLEYVAGPNSFYAGGGYDVYEGKGVADNSRIQAGAGMAHTIYQTPNDELVTGIDLTYMSYDKNLRLYTLGQGGYYSPQSFVSASVPLDYRAREGNLTYRIGGTLGLTSWREDKSPIFANSSTLQSQLEALSAADPTIAAFYSGQSKTGVSGGLRGDVEYALTPNLRLGGLLRYDRSADWNEVRGMVFARYRFDN